jgi:hypothetical protein
MYSDRDYPSTAEHFELETRLHGAVKSSDVQALTEVG